MQNTAPIALFVYNRPFHTRKTLEALEAADLAQETDVFIFADGAKNADMIPLVNEVRAILGEPWTFKTLTIIERERNMGLAANIIDGVTKVVNKYGRIIVLEDDLEISKVGLRYFNDALGHYEHEEKVMSIGGYMYPVKHIERLPDSFLFRVICSWGWATWKPAWEKFETDIDLLTQDFSKEDIKRFSVDHSENFWKQVHEFKSGKINSWAIRWYLSVFKHGGLTLYPKNSVIQNIGTDGSGTHSDEEDVYHTALAIEPINKFPSVIAEDPVAYEAIKAFYSTRKGNLLQRLVRYTKKLWKKIIR